MDADGIRPIAGQPDTATPWACGHGKAETRGGCDGERRGDRGVQCETGCALIRGPLGRAARSVLGARAGVTGAGNGGAETADG